MRAGNVLRYYNSSTHYEVTTRTIPIQTHALTQWATGKRLHKHRIKNNGHINLSTSRLNKSYIKQRYCTVFEFILELYVFTFIFYYKWWTFSKMLNRKLDLFKDKSTVQPLDLFCIFSLKTTLQVSDVNTEAAMAVWSKALIKDVRFTVLCFKRNYTIIQCIIFLIPYYITKAACWRTRKQHKLYKNISNGWHALTAY